MADSPEQQELEAIASRERAKLGELEDSLRSAALPVELAGTALADLVRAREGLDALISWARTAALDELNQLPARACFAFRRSIAARTSLLRHTPALEGTPAALDPSQRSSGAALVDYARGGYLLFEDPSQAQGVRFDDHPRLAALASSISTTLGRGVPSLLFSSGMGAINTVLDLIAARPGRAVIGAHSWIEVQEYVQHTWPGRFEPIEETAVGAALADPSIASIVLEPLANHPRMPAVDVKRLLGGPIAGNKAVVLDLALTPELDVGPLPPNLWLAIVTSGVKFFQAGWDISKSGLVELMFDPSDLEDPHSALIQLRGRSGRVLSVEEAELADLETPETFRARINRLDTNTRLLAQRLDMLLREANLGSVGSPWLETHPHHAAAMALGTGGRFVYLELDPVKVPEARLKTLDRELAIAAKASGVALMVATTFGLALPHVCLLAHPVEGFRLRLSAGSGPPSAVEAMVAVVRKVLVD